MMNKNYIKKTPVGTFTRCPQNQLKKKAFTLLMLFGLFSLILSSCKKTDQYYDVLKQQPEVFRNYDPLYEVGTIMLIEGRFNQTDLEIRIGDAAAEIIKIEKRDYLIDFGVRDSIMQVSVRINEAMGIGTKRPVSITSFGITIQAPAIEIIENSQSGVLPQKLTVMKIADYPANADPVYCRNGRGNLYFVDKTSYIVKRMDASGVMTLVFEPSVLKDSDGKPFTFTRLNGLGIDPKERYLYLSLYSQAIGSQITHFYRLVRYDLQNSTVTVLNETKYARLTAQRTLQAIQPFEGDIAQVKMLTATGVYPDGEGNVFFEMDQRFMTKLAKDGSYTYLFKLDPVNTSQVTNPLDPAPQIYDPNTSQYYHPMKAIQFFPGAQVDILRFRNTTFNPQHQEYWHSFNRISLANQTPINSFVGTGKMKGKQEGNPFISGSFDVLTGAHYYKDRWGQMPLGKGKLLILYYQNSKHPDFPAWGILDFEEKRGYRYAPGAFDAKGHSFRDTDLLLEYDADGMLYLTANNKQVILKTIYQ